MNFILKSIGKATEIMNFNPEKYKKSKGNNEFYPEKYRIAKSCKPHHRFQTRGNITYSVER